MYISPILNLHRLRDLLRVVESAPSYNQGRVHHACGTPACAMGHYMAAYPKGRLAAINEHEHFGISWAEAEELFGESGCGNADRSKRKAAAYIREFIKRKTAA